MSLNSRLEIHEEEEKEEELTAASPKLTWHDPKVVTSPKLTDAPCRNEDLVKAAAALTLDNSRLEVCDSGIDLGVVNGSNQGQDLAMKMAQTKARIWP